MNQLAGESFKEYIFRLSKENRHKEDGFWPLKKAIIEQAEEGKITFTTHLTTDEYNFVKRLGFHVDRRYDNDTILFY